MGELDVAVVDVAAVLGAAGQYDAAAETVQTAVRNLLSGLRFDGALAGRMHTARGEALRAAIDELVTGMRQWTRAAGEIAAELRSCAARYVDADARGADRVG